jgi:murein DD-endopeptidase MepM/ murein hydrolase activator NlpD
VKFVFLLMGSLLLLVGLPVSTSAQILATPTPNTSERTSDDASPADASDPGLTIHVVQRGETLYGIGLQYGLTAQQLADLNGIFDQSNIRVGQRLLVPADDTAEPLPQTHTVQPGESLSVIAESYGVDVSLLLQQNNLSSADVIYPGQELTIAAPRTLPPPPQSADAERTPAASEPADSATAVAEADTGILDNPSSPTISGNIHTVAAGETLFRIATTYGLSTAELADANNISDPTRIYTGQQLIIPGFDPVAELDLPAPIVGLDVQPLIFKEGETGSVEVSTESFQTVIATFLGNELTVQALDSGQRHVMLIPVPLFTEAGVYPLTLFATGQDGTVTEFTFNIRISGGGYPTQNLNVSAEMMNLLAPAVQDNELQLIENITRIVTDVKYFDSAFSIPAAAAMNAPFGTRRSYNGGEVNSFHSGADFASAPGTPIFAAAPGKVVLTDTLNIRGNTVIIDHGWGVYSAYAHLQGINVALGDVVETGQIIGSGGSTGRVTGPHLHWEIWVHGVPVNPLQWLQRSFP